jgi:GT2 family glycosyltransferase
VRVEVFRQAGLFDELYFAYSEDADMCVRAKACGFTIMHNPNAVVTHYPSAATIKNKGKWFRDYYVTRNKLRLVSKHVHGPRWIMFLLYFACRYLAAPIVYFAVTGQFKRIVAVVLGAGDFVRNRFNERYT